jgi:acyl-CoA thioester hydrolase
MHWPGTVEIGTRVEAIGRSSVTLLQGLFVADRCVAIAQSVVVLMSAMTRQSMLLPPETAAALGAFARPNSDCAATALGVRCG